MALKQHVSLYIMPFHIKAGMQKMFEPADDSIWKPCQISFDKGKLYSHISRFLRSDNNDTNAFRYKYYSLSNRATLIKNMLRKKMAVSIENTDGTKRNIVFRLGEAEMSREEKIAQAQKDPQSKLDPSQLGETQEKFFSPKLVLCPSVGVGLLIFSIYLDESSDLSDNFSIENLVDLNYTVFKTYPPESSQTHPIYLKSQIDISDLEYQLNGLSDSDSSENRGRLERRIEGMRNSLQTKIDETDKALLKDKTENIEDWNWTMTEFTERLMADFSGKYERFDPYRLHVFTYLQADESDKSQKLLDDYIHIIKLQNANYKQIDSNEQTNLYEQSFENIYMGCSVEGGAIMTLVGDGSNFSSQSSTFIRDFMKSSLSQSYICTYVMIQIQRYTMLFIEHNLTQHNYLVNSVEVRNTLRHLIGSATQNKVNSYFVDISDHTQHNQFYSLCCRNLRVKVSSDNIEHKLEMLTDYLKVLTEQEGEEGARRRDDIGRWITVIGAVFALFSCTYDAFELFNSEYLGLFTDSTPLFCRFSCVFGSIILIALIFWFLARLYVGRKR